MSSAQMIPAAASEARDLTDQIKAGFAEQVRLRAFLPSPPQAVHKTDRRYVYFIQAETGHIKIGVAGDPRQRLQILQTMSPVALRLIGVIACGGQALEQELHVRFAVHRSHGEWFHYSDEIVDYIQECK